MKATGCPAWCAAHQSYDDGELIHVRHVEAGEHVFEISQDDDGVPRVLPPQVEVGLSAAELGLFMQAVVRIMALIDPEVFVESLASAMGGRS